MALGVRFPKVDVAIALKIIYWTSGNLTVLPSFDIEWEDGEDGYGLPVMFGKECASIIECPVDTNCAEISVGRHKLILSCNQELKSISSKMEIEVTDASLKDGEDDGPVIFEAEELTPMEAANKLKEVVEEFFKHRMVDDLYANPEALKKALAESDD